MPTETAEGDPCCGGACGTLPPSAEQIAERVAVQVVGALRESVAGWDAIYALRGSIAQAPAEAVARALWVATGAAISEPETES